MKPVSKLVHDLFDPGQFPYSKAKAQRISQSCLDTGNLVAYMRKQQNKDIMAISPKLLRNWKFGSLSEKPTAQRHDGNNRKSHLTMNR